MQFITFSTQILIEREKYLNENGDSGNINNNAINSFEIPYRTVTYTYTQASVNKRSFR